VNQKCDSTFEIITLWKNTLDFYNFCFAVIMKKRFSHTWKIYPPHLNNVLRHLVKMTHHISHFNALSLSSSASSVMWSIKFIMYSLQRKQIDSHKVCSKKSAIDTNTSTQACWPLVNCVVNQQVFQAMPHTHSRPVAAYQCHELWFRWWMDAEGINHSCFQICKRKSIKVFQS